MLSTAATTYPSKMNPIYIFTPHALKMNFNIILPPTSKAFQILSSLPVFQIKFSKHFSTHTIRSALLIPHLKSTDILPTAQTTSNPP